MYSLCTDVRPSQDHRILCMQTVRIKPCSYNQICNVFQPACRVKLLCCNLTFVKSIDFRQRYFSEPVGCYDYYYNLGYLEENSFLCTVSAEKFALFFSFCGRLDLCKYISYLWSVRHLKIDSYQLSVRHLKIDSYQLSVRHLKIDSYHLSVRHSKIDSYQCNLDRILYSVEFPSVLK